jgi:hypothetical protein
MSIKTAKFLCREFATGIVRRDREASGPAKGLVSGLLRKPGNSWANRAGPTGKGSFRRADAGFCPYRKPMVRRSMVTVGIALEQY